MEREHVIKALELWAASVEHCGHDRGETPYKAAWANFKPHEAAENALIEIEQISAEALRQIRSALDLANERFVCWEGLQDAKTWADFTGAVRYLGERIRAALEVIGTPQADSKPTAAKTVEVLSGPSDTTDQQDNSRRGRPRGTSLSKRLEVEEWQRTYDEDDKLSWTGVARLFGTEGKEATAFGGTMRKQAARHKEWKAKMKALENPPNEFLEFLKACEKVRTKNQDE